MNKHPFIFNSGTWVGEGKISLNTVDEELLFNTNWTVPHKDEAGKIACAQDIQVQGLGESMRNDLSFYNFRDGVFSVDMENQNIGRITGSGVFDDQMIAWEFRNNDLYFEGFETYILQPDGGYLMHGEYVTSDQFRTRIEARLWMGTKEISNLDESQEEEP